jgi:hypothetical protein
VRSPRGPAPLLGFFSLQHLPAPGVHFLRVSQSRYVPSSGFGHPLDGLLPPEPGRACFVPTAFLGFPPSELSPPERWPLRFHTRRTCLTLAARKPSGEPPGGTGDTAFQALALSGIPGLPRGFSTRTGWMLPWGSPLPGFGPAASLRLLAELPFRALPRPPRAAATGALGCQSTTDLLGSGFVSKPIKAEPSDPHRVLAPVQPIS